MSAVPERQWSAEPKREATAAIARAQRDLEQAVAELERLPALDLHSIALAVHAMTSFLTVTGAIVDHLIPVLREHPDPQVGVWLDGLAHATALMTHTVSELMNHSADLPTTLRLEDVAVSGLVERACAYYRRAAGSRNVEIRFRAGPAVPVIQTDRVLVAAILDGLLSNALKRSRPGARVSVDVELERDGVVCHVRDEGGEMNPSPDYGLAVARHFAEQMGGQLTFDSIRGQGTTVSLRLPRG